MDSSVRSVCYNDIDKKGLLFAVYKKREEHMNRNPIGQKALSLLLSFALACSVFSLDTTGVWAAQSDSGNIRFTGSSGDSGAGGTITITISGGTVAVTDGGYNGNRGGAGIGGGNNGMESILHFEKW